MIIQRILTGIFLLALTACATPDPYEPASPNRTYICDNADQMVVAMGDRAQSAAISYQGRDITLRRMDTPADGLAFSNSIFTLYHDGERAALEREGVPLLTNCRAL